LLLTLCNVDQLDPAGARTSHLRTLSKISSAAEPSGPASRGVSLKGAAHLTADFEFVNTLNPFFSPRLTACLQALSEGARIVHNLLPFGKGVGEVFRLNADFVLGSFRRTLAASRLHAPVVIWHASAATRFGSLGRIQQNSGFKPSTGLKVEPARAGPDSLPVEAVRPFKRSAGLAEA